MANTAQAVLEMPERTREISNVTRKMTYRAGQRNILTIELDKKEVLSYVTFSAARLVQIAVRPQEVRDKNNENGPMINRIVLSAGIILDDFECGLLNEDDTDAGVHPLLSDPRVGPRYREFPHRVNGQQWMNLDDLPRAVALAHYLQENKQFRIAKNPNNRPDSQRKTKDLFRVHPINPLDPNNPGDFGASLESFEVSMNPDYGPGFSSFYQGLNEQFERLLSANSEENPDRRKSRLDALAPNLHFIGGVHHDDVQRQYFARPVDIGSVTIDGHSFPLYPVSGSKLDVNELLNEIKSGSESTGSTVAPVAAPELDLPAPDDDQQF